LVSHQEAISGFSPVGDTGNMPLPVYLLWETPEMKEWLLLVALGVHFPSLLYSFLRVRKPEVIPRLHFRFVDPMPEMESLFLLP
jgi:hypothetical protein